MKNSTNSTSRSLFYWHSEGLSLSETKDHDQTLCVNSANLIDFMVSVSKLTTPSIISGPKVEWKGSVTLPIKADQVVADGKLQLTSKRKMLTTLPIFIYSLLFGTLATCLRDSSISASVGLSGTGTMVGLTKVLLFRKQHAFIVRGDRLTTVTNSSRKTINRKFVATRIRFYNWLMLQLVKRDRAEIWFQGRAHYEKLVETLPANCSPRLKVLDAVLRELPTINKKIEKSYDLIYVGRITVEKGLLELVAALRILSDSGLNLTLCIVGDGPDKNSIISAAKEANVTEQIHWTGFVSDSGSIVRLLTSSKLFVLPSYTEGLPRSLLEAASIGLPCIATPVGGIPFLFKHNKSIFFVQPRDSKNLADQIHTTYQDEIDGNLSSVKKIARTLANTCSFENKAKYFYENACLEIANE